MAPQTSLNIDPDRQRYRVLIGTGGVGAGSFFAMNGNQTLGREESRSGRFLDRRDYCKLHIITHYIHTLMGAGFTTVPISKVGDDQHGQLVLQEMTEAGLDIDHMQTVVGGQTLYSICLVYPDGSGGNITTDNSACAQVDAAYVRQAEADFSAFDGNGIALAVPEVPLEAREELLKIATDHQFLRAASFNSQEMAWLRSSGVLKMVDLLAINIHEAAVLAGVSAEQAPVAVVKAAIETVQQIRPELQLSITAGMHGSWAWDGQALSHVPCQKVNVVSTAGAGDAHFAGVLVGLAAGLSLAEAQELGGLVGALSVTSPHTINKEISCESLRTFVTKFGLPLPDKVKELLVNGA